MICDKRQIVLYWQAMDDSPLSSQAQIKEFLRPLLLGVEEEELDALAQEAVVRALPAQALVCREGEIGDAVYVVIAGEVEVFKRMDDETEHHLHTTGAGEFFGEMAVLQESARTATVRTTQPTTILEIGRDPFLNALGRSPSLGIRIMVRLTNRLRDSDQQAIAKLSQANAELTRMLHQLERLDRTKSDFIQVAAHELRTPVAALTGYAQIMQSDPAVQNTAGMRALVDGIAASAERLHRIFNSILDVSKVMSGELQVRRSPVSLSLVLRGISSDFGAALKERNLSLKIEGLEGLPYCPGDPDLLYKALHHLVNNAIKYTPNGGRITVSGQLTRSPELGKCIEVAVQDTGIGIARADLDLIFEKFYRQGEVAFHSSGTTQFKGGGPGLGLTIAQGIVVAHGGRIWAESPGYDEATCPGSRFVVQLPVGSDT